MNKFESENRFAERIKKALCDRHKISVLGIDDPYSPMPSGTKGTVIHVDDAAQLHMEGDNGRTFDIVPGADSFKKLTDEEITEEQTEYMD